MRGRAHPLERKFNERKWWIIRLRRVNSSLRRPETIFWSIFIPNFKDFRVKGLLEFQNSKSHFTAKDYRYYGRTKRHHIRHSKQRQRKSNYRKKNCWKIFSYSSKSYPFLVEQLHFKRHCCISYFLPVLRVWMILCDRCTIMPCETTRVSDDFGRSQHCGIENASSTWLKSKQDDGIKYI